MIIRVIHDPSGDERAIPVEPEGVEEQGHTMYQLVHQGFTKEQPYCPVCEENVVGFQEETAA